jgi:type IX secretion system PorP/SprF family membrane protein
LRYIAQWVGLDGAPVTNAVSVNTPLNNSKLGLGVSIINDRIGPTQENTISADLSYTIPTSETVKLSFGIKATANLFNLDVNRLNPLITILVCKTLIINFHNIGGGFIYIQTRRM